jgi:hypothetical protein
MFAGTRGVAVQRSTLLIAAALLDLAEIPAMRKFVLRADQPPPGSSPMASPRRPARRRIASAGGDCRELLRSLLPLEPGEIEFLRLVNEQGEVRPELLTADEQLRALIRSQPGLEWKVKNVREHRGVAGDV